jgi:hypothetical protein
VGMTMLFGEFVSALLPQSYRPRRRARLQPSRKSEQVC